MDIPREKLIKMYESIVLSRHLQKKILELNETTKDFSGGIHLRVGEEAPAAAIYATILEDDYVGGHLGGENFACSKGVPLGPFLANMMGRQVPVENRDGAGKARPAPKVALKAPTSGALGDAQCSNMGIAFAAKLSGLQRVVVSVFGDGTAARGPLHECMNLAGLWKLPVVFVCINNQYGISTRVSQSCTTENIAERATAYGMSGLTVDGNDVLACYEAIFDAVKLTRAGECPRMVEAKTYRLSPHCYKTYHGEQGYYEADPEPYRTKEEVELAWQAEPLGRYRETLLGMGVLTQADVERCDLEAKTKVEEAASFAIRLPYVDSANWLANASA